MSVSVAKLQRLYSAIQSLYPGDHKSWNRHISKIVRILESDELKPIAEYLSTEADVQAWIQNVEKSQGGMIGSAELQWPESPRESCGLAIALIKHLNSDQQSALQIGHTLFGNRKFDDDLSDLVRTIILPFYDDFSEYLEDANLIEADVQEVREPPITNRVFLVHGRDGAIKNEVARFLERLGLEVVILHERPNKGRTLISKFQEESADVSFAVVLVTPDDVGGLAQGHAQPRARQNVVFELGFFIGRLGSHRVCALMADGVERPSDYDGVAYVPLDPTGGWKSDLTRELAAARIPVDFAKAFAS